MGYRCCGGIPACHAGSTGSIPVYPSASLRGSVPSQPLQRAGRTNPSPIGRGLGLGIKCYGSTPDFHSGRGGSIPSILTRSARIESRGIEADVVAPASRVRSTWWCRRTVNPLLRYGRFDPCLAHVNVLKIRDQRCLHQSHRWMLSCWRWRTYDGFCAKHNRTCYIRCHQGR